MHLLIKLIHILRNKFLNSWQIDQKMLKLLTIDINNPCIDYRYCMCKGLT